MILSVLVFLLGFLSGMVGSPDSAWFQSLEKPAIYPEPKWFGIIWSVLYVMIGLAVAMVAAAWGARGRGIAFGLGLFESWPGFGAPWPGFGADAPGLGAEARPGFGA